MPSLAAADFSLDTRYLSGQPAPGSGPFELASFTSIGTGSINAHGQIAFSANVRRAEQIGQPFVTRNVIFSEGAGSLGNAAPVVRVGYPVVGAAAGASYEVLFAPLISDAGNVSFFGERDDISIPPSQSQFFNGQSLFMTSPDAPGDARHVFTIADEPVAALGGESIKYGAISGSGIYIDDNGGFVAQYGYQTGLVPGSPPREEVISTSIFAGDANGISRVFALGDQDTFPGLDPTKRLGWGRNAVIADTNGHGESLLIARTPPRPNLFSTRRLPGRSGRRPSCSRR